jgi:type I restriction enzyme S subunit
VILPPLPEQEKIVKYLDDKTFQIDNLISLTEKKIEVLKQKRTSLINEVITRGLDPKVELKDSGVEWIGMIPKHWEVRKIKYLGSINSGETLPSELIEEEGEYPVYGGNGVLGFYFNYNYSKPVLSIGRVGEKCGVVHLVSEKVWINDNSLVFEPIKLPMNLIYIYYSLVIRNLNSLRNQNTQPLITGTLVKNESITYPPLLEQEEIVKYIDTHTTEIDNLISIEQRRIETLKEYRQSMISEVITGKLNVN